MFEQEITIVKGLTASQIGNPVLRELSRRYTGEVAPPCAAEALVKALDPGRASHVWQVN